MYKLTISPFHPMPNNSREPATSSRLAKPSPGVKQLSRSSDRDMQMMGRREVSSFQRFLGIRVFWGTLLYPLKNGTLLFKKKNKAVGARAKTNSYLVAAEFSPSSGRKLHPAGRAQDAQEFRTLPSGVLSVAMETERQSPSCLLPFRRHLAVSSI